jgi:hypothetical protein
MAHTVLRVETWHGDDLRDVSLIAVPIDTATEVIGYVNGADPSSLTTPVRDALEVAASQLPATERRTLEETAHPLREYVGAVAIRSLGAEIVPTAVLRDQLK